MEPGFHIGCAGRWPARSHPSIQVFFDDFTRECLTLIADASLPGLRVARELDGLIAGRGPGDVCVRQRHELTSKAVLRWSHETQAEWRYIAPGKPQIGHAS
jgi:hypothetical protein